MEYDSGSSFEGRLKDLEDSERADEIAETNNRAEREIRSSSSFRWYNLDQTPTSGKTILPVVKKKTLSSQVMEYYQKYSQNSSLGRYFSLPEQQAINRNTNYHIGEYESNFRSKTSNSAFQADDERFRQDLSIPRERRRWARPPLIGQPSTDVPVTSNYVAVDSRTPSPISKRPVETILEESSRETLAEPRDNEIKPSVSPTSSVASHKPLEWDSGADVGYYNDILPKTKEKEKNLCTIERMALARGCSVAMRLDPEGTNESTTSSNRVGKNSMKPDANSTPLIAPISGESESEIEITPIVKNHRSTSSMIKTSDDNHANSRELEKTHEANDKRETSIKYPTEGSCSKDTKRSVNLSPLKKSSSMNLLALPLSRLSLKRSQSELNLRRGEKKFLPLIFDSTSSIATVVNKPATCDKFIQTSLDGFSRESIGIQVEVNSDDAAKFNEDIDENLQEKKKENDSGEEEKPPLPKRASSLAPKSLHSILKNSSNTYNVRDRNVPASLPSRKIEEKTNYTNENIEKIDGTVRTRYRNRIVERQYECNSSSEPSRNESLSTRSEIIIEETTEENATGRASNSFEYFPGHVYQNVPNGSTSQVSSCDTGRESRCSTVPNTSSSIDEKLWGDSDSLVRDLERSVNILKSLVDANKCDKQVKKRLIHHVIKRLVSAKYTDDRIEHDLEENVPWNPADTRNKVYRNDIIQALAGNKQQNTTDSSIDDWRPRKRNGTRGNSVSPKKNLSKETRPLKNVIDIPASSRESTINSDKFPFDRHTDRTVMDGRKARMGLRSEDHRQDTNTDGEKSQSSECFMPQSKNQQKIKSTNVFYNIERSNEKTRESLENLARNVTTTVATTTSTTNTTSSNVTSASHGNPISDRIVLIKERRRTESNGTDWRLPTTMSEKRFELGRCSNSESGDTKLINYAEMEKRNQIVWITNEISHLCNLKRLLEEPIKVEGRLRGGNSPRKKLAGLPIDQWILKAQTERNSSSRTEQARGTGSEGQVEDIPRNESLEKIMKNQWSSHGNLASGRSDQRASINRDDERVDRVGHTRKRNSCTQTGSDGGPSGHSKTGGEIVSATSVFASTNSTRIDRETALGMRDASVQTRSISAEINSSVVPTSNQADTDLATRMVPSSSISARIQSQSNVDEKTRKGNRKHVCYCQRYAAHSRHRACIIHSPQKSTREHSKNCSRRSLIKSDDERSITQPIVTQISASSSRFVGSRKEAKNQLNATCKSNYAIRELPTRSRNRCAQCNGEKISSIPEVVTGTLKTASKISRNNDSVEIFVCPRDCNCDDEQTDDTGNEGNREKEDEIETTTSVTGSEMENETRFRRNSSLCPRCTCNVGEHHSTDTEVGVRAGNQNLRKNTHKSEINVAEKSCKSCRTCGTTWPVKDGKTANRRCKCSQDYLKPVAYELKFDEKTKEKSKNVRGKKMTKNDKIVTKGLSTGTKIQSKVAQSAPIVQRSHGNRACDEDHEEDDEKVENQNENEDKHQDTLRDFLATNKPEFLENVETRRRYMSEISQLRQLKREKRKQFLAMAGATDFLKPQRPVKVSTANSQKKLTEYEMKLRLRMRYLRLNEVRNKRRQREKEEDARRNHLMAKLFGQKLQQKVLKGQVDLSQSVSVISNL